MASIEDFGNDIVDFKMIRNPNSIDVSLLILLAAIWGSAFLGIKIALVELEPLSVVFFRVGIGFLVLVPWCLWRGFIFPSSGRQWGLVLIIALLNVIAPFLLISWAQQTIDASVAALLMGAGPLMSVFAAHFTTFDDKLNLFKLLGVVLGFTGIMFVIGPSAFSSLGDDLIAQGAALLGNVSYVVSGILIRKVQNIPPTRFSTLVLGISTLGLLPLFLIADFPPIAELSYDTIWAVLYLGALPTGLGYILRYHLIKTVGMSFFAMGINLIPVFGVMFGALFLNEPLTLYLGIALGFVVTGLFVARINSNSAENFLKPRKRNG